jgi:hypothetical protein
VADGEERAGVDIYGDGFRRLIRRNASWSAREAAIGSAGGLLSRNRGECMVCSQAFMAKTQYSVASTSSSGETKSVSCHVIDSILPLWLLTLDKLVSQARSSLLPERTGA